MAAHSAVDTNRISLRLRMTGGWTVGGLVLLFAGCISGQPSAVREPKGLPLRELEDAARPLAQPLSPPQPGDWLREHPEEGQTFAQFYRLKPKRRGQELAAIYLVLLGDFSPQQQEVLDITQRYLSVFFQVPVHVRRQLPLSEIPDDARRVHPSGYAY